MDFLNKKGIEALNSLRDEVASLRETIDELCDQQERHYRERNAEGSTQVRREINAEVQAAQRETRVFQVCTLVVSSITALATVGAFIAAVIYAGYAKAQWGEMRQATLQVKRQIAMDQRAWLMINIDYSDKETRLTPPDRIEVPVKLQNIGKTPAKNICGFIVVTEIPRKEASSYVPGDISKRNAIKAAVIYPTLAHTTGTNEFQRGKAILATPGKDRLFDRGELIFMVYGTIEYEDIFHVQHWFSFCHPVSKVPIERSQACVENNDVDRNDE